MSNVSIYPFDVPSQILYFEVKGRLTLSRTDVWFERGKRGGLRVDNHIDYVRVSWPVGRVDGCENQMLSKSRVSLLDRPSVRPPFDRCV